jgi:transposase
MFATEPSRLEPYFPKSHGKPRVDDRRVLSGIIFVNRNGLRWRDAPKDYGPHKTLYNRWKRWGEKGVFTRMMEGLSAAGAERKTVMIDATYLKGKRGLEAAAQAASASGTFLGGCQFHGNSSSHRAAGQSAAILAMTSAM